MNTDKNQEQAFTEDKDTAVADDAIGDAGNRPASPEAVDDRKDPLSDSFDEEHDSEDESDDDSDDDSDEDDDDII